MNQLENQVPQKFPGFVLYEADCVTLATLDPVSKLQTEIGGVYFLEAPSLSALSRLSGIEEGRLKLFKSIRSDYAGELLYKTRKK